MYFRPHQDPYAALSRGVFRPDFNKDMGVIGAYELFFEATLDRHLRDADFIPWVITFIGLVEDRLAKQIGDMVYSD